MTEACEAVTDYAFGALDVEKFILKNATKNTKSSRVKVKQRARLIGHEDLKFVDPSCSRAEVWELTKKEWMNSRRYERN